MPEKTKDQKEVEIEEKNKKRAKKEDIKKTKPSKSSNSTVKSSTSTTAKTSAKKSTSSKTKTTTKKSTVAKKNIKTKKDSNSINLKNNKKSKTIDVLEYYDLPYRYNQTVVKVLAQTPKNLFIYWDISDTDRENYKKQYGDNFFETTKPVLTVYNDTFGYSFEVDINDFANSWYLQVTDAKCDYRIELGRRPIVYNEKINTDYIYISTSNEIEAPNDKILFNKEQKMVYFRDIKTGKETQKPISNISFIRNMGKIYNIYDLYKAVYKDENVEEIYDLSNPSSGNPSSKFK